MVRYEWKDLKSNNEVSLLSQLLNEMMLDISTYSVEVEIQNPADFSANRLFEILKY